ncbi:SH3 domain-containing protein [Streptomyces griseoviridis]|uniref:SH3 domain-containing protein n=2 Tax=Streptomyces TaxID=1883 RepID=A0A3S9ZB90_STRGD|nr:MULTISPECIES: SH3 domain-containing protein [Streptomyces]AZS85098.1 SH3 domain-containing protein [Streptomyces griseoviridis]MDH6701543.1 hypothetical protein [Streptomyces sp. MAA16]MDT0474688.1 SH3 domain-containing protein [Streptomyces sp. DSM 41014]QCN88051.1 SH3 domain-containing protein [Streptomyces griseoviridis]
MSLRSALTRLAIVTAAGALVASAAAAPAVADDDWDGGDGGHSHHDGDRPHRYWGRVTADELLLRSRPDRHSEVIRVAHYGERVSIDCKTAGQRVDDNPLWYLLTDGTWAWGSARYIDNIGPAPRWC